MKRPKIGLALGGGGAKGMAHIGVIKVLEENNIPIDFISGTSIGSLIGGFYAFSKNIKEIEEIALKNNFMEYLSIFLDPSLNQGLIKGEKVTKFIEEYIGKTKFEDLKIPLTTVSTNIKNGSPVIDSTGLVSSGIRASISIPALFKPVERNGVFLADGGLSIPVPTQIVKAMGADIVIAVNLYKNYINTDTDKIGFYKIVDNSKDILLHHLANENSKTADIIINPKVDVFGWDSLFTPEKSKKVIHAGEIVTNEKVQQIKRLFNKKSKKWYSFFTDIFK